MSKDGQGHKSGSPQKGTPHSWLKVGLGLAFMVGLTIFAGVVLKTFLDDRPMDLTEATRGIMEQVEEVLAYNHVPRSAIRKTDEKLTRNNRAQWYSFEIAVDVPANLSLSGLTELLIERLRERYVEVDVRSQADGEAVLGLTMAGENFATVYLKEVDSQSYRPSEEEMQRQLELPPIETSNREPVPAEPSQESVSEPLIFPDSQKVPKVAIIIDDGGEGGPVSEAILALDPRLTLSILPGRPKSTQTAQRAGELGFEVMLHMPMENHGNGATFPGELKVDMSADDVARRTSEALAQVPGAVGVNNHTGSLFTADREAMERFLAVVRDQGLYFIDSRTTVDTVALDTAQSMGIPSSRRHVFLDNRADETYIREQFAELVEWSRKRGAAIGICHFRSVTAQVLEELLTEWDEYGVQLVHVSELL